MFSFDVYKKIDSFLSQDFKELFIICPFISLDGLKKVFSSIENIENKKIKIITRWRKLDVITGVSDIRIYPFLKEKNIKLFHNDYIHLKVLIKDRKSCLLGSANITYAGLGLSKTPNIELVTETSCSINDYKRFEDILDDSYAIDDAFFLQMQKIKKENKDKMKIMLDIKNKYLTDLEWEEFLKPTWNKKDFFMKKWS